MNFCGRYRFVQLFAILIWVGFGDTTTAQPQQANITHLTVGQGLSGLSALNFHVDIQSNIWIETENGLDIWDGRRFEKTSLPVLQTKNNLYTVQNISSIAEDENQIYFLYDNYPTSFHCYTKANRTFKTVPYDDGFTTKQDHIITQIDENDQPWIMTITNDDIVLKQLWEESYIQLSRTEFGGNKIEEYTVGPSNIWIRDDANNIYEVSHEGSVKKFNLAKLTNKLNIPQVMNVFCTDREGSLWYSIPGFTGLFVQNRAETSPRRIKEIPDNVLVVNLWQDNLGRKLIGLSDARQVVRKYMIADEGKVFKPWNYLAQISTLPTKIVSSDFHKLIYFGTHQGLNIIRFRPSYLDSHLAKNDVSTGQYGNIIISTSAFGDDQSLIISEDNESFIHSPRKNDRIESLAHQYVGQLPIYIEPLDKIYSIFHASRPEPSVVIEYNVQTNDTSQYPLPLRSTSAVQLTDTTILYTGNHNRTKTIVKFNINAKSREVFQTDEFPLISSSDVNFSFRNEKRDRIYFCTFDNGLLYSAIEEGMMLPAKKFVVDALPTTNVITIAEDKNNNLLIGTYDGLFIVEPSRPAILRKIDQTNGLSNNVVVAAIQDNDGRYWASTFSGLNVIHPSDYSIGAFYHQDGISHNEFNRNAVHKDKGGMLYFGSANGFTTIDPQLYSTYRSPFLVQFSTAEIRTKHLDIHLDTLPNKTIDVAANTLTHLDILLGNNSWGTTDKVTYFYKIQGLDKEWQTSTNGNIRIDRLPPGHYDILFKAMSSYGQWSSNMETFPVNIFVPFFQKNWVRIVLLALLLALLASSYFIV